MWRASYTIPFLLVAGLVLAMVWPPGAAVVLALVVILVRRWIAAERGRTSGDGAP